MPSDEAHARMAWAQQIVDQLQYRPEFRFVVEMGLSTPYLQVEVWRPDVKTKEWGFGRGGRFFISPEATESDVVRQAFALVEAFELHERREFFTYRGVNLFNPHITVDALMRAAIEGTEE